MFQQKLVSVAPSNAKPAVLGRHPSRSEEPQRILSKFWRMLLGLILCARAITLCSSLCECSANLSDAMRSTHLTKSHEMSTACAPSEQAVVLVQISQQFFEEVQLPCGKGSIHMTMTSHDFSCRVMSCRFLCFHLT
jgi:hypothetical protein